MYSRELLDENSQILLATSAVKIAVFLANQTFQDEIIEHICGCVANSEDFKKLDTIEGIHIEKTTIPNFYRKFKVNFP